MLVPSQLVFVFAALIMATFSLVRPRHDWGEGVLAYLALSGAYSGDGGAFAERPCVAHGAAPRCAATATTESEVDAREARRCALRRRGGRIYTPRRS